MGGLEEEEELFYSWFCSRVITWVSLSQVFSSSFHELAYAWFGNVGVLR